jgi:ubiquitin-protein ligase
MFVKKAKDLEIVSSNSDINYILKNILAIIGNAIYKRLFNELLKLEQLEFKSKFILNDNQMVLSGSSKCLLRFNKTTTPQRFHVKALCVTQGRFFPQTEPYCRASFLIEIILPREYPFKGPKLIFLDPIYHPNVDESGEQCCG